MSSHPPHPLFQQRRAGVLLPLRSLPGDPAAGLLGDPALRFLDWLADAGFGWWQMLPVGPTGPGGSPYSSPSAFAGDPVLAGAAGGGGPANETGGASGGGEAADARAAELEAFREQEKFWLKNWADFRTRNADGSAAEEGDDQQARHHQVIEEQFCFDRQWQRLRQHAADRGVRLLGDLPLFVELDSADVAAHPELFRLGHNGQPEVVTGVPPDAFSATGQLWGHPHYRWEIHRALDFHWWLERFARQLRLFDAVRIDHFIGFQNAWEVPSKANNAANGRWRLAPGGEIFEALARQLRELGQPEGLPLLAEDLGEVTLPVQQLRDRFGLPGMRILQHAFDEEDSPNLPENCPPVSVAYSGTHDNDSLNGWLTHMEARQRALVLRYAGGSYGTMVRDLLRKLLGGGSNLVVLPMQDLLGLGTEARTNTPATTEGNWQWRMEEQAANKKLATRLRGWLEEAGRLPG